VSSTRRISQNSAIKRLGQCFVSAVTRMRSESGRAFTVPFSPCFPGLIGSFFRRTLRLVDLTDARPMN
jgi:hypothetical protein